MRRGIFIFFLLTLAAASGAAPVARAGEFLAEPITVPETKAVFAEVKSRTVVPARARIGGTIKTISVREGDVVSADQVIALVVDPGLACTGVNFQHDLTSSMLGLASGFTRVMHNIAGHHAADGALPMVLAAIDPYPQR